MITWQLKTFDNLNAAELYTIMRIRQEVFVFEQNCVFIDADDKDQHCHHLSGYLRGSLIAYARVLPPGLSYPEPSIGRIVTSPEYRRYGYGRELMARSLEIVKTLYSDWPVKIEAQLYLKAFYESYGFVAGGEPYILDNILHIIMVRP